jgi:membrane fusion protein (multidrug efflux system)
MLVGADDKVEIRTVKTGPVWGSLQVVTEGVKAGERVVVEGFQKARPGMQVAAKPAPAELAGGPPESGPPPSAPPAEPAAPTPPSPAVAAPKG